MRKRVPNCDNTMTRDIGKLLKACDREDAPDNIQELNLEPPPQKGLQTTISHFFH
jgi:hypothetical protein